MKNLLTTLTLSLALVAPVQAADYIRFVDLVGTARNEASCRRQALAYLNQLRKIKPITIEKSDYYEYYPQVDDCYAVYYERLTTP